MPKISFINFRCGLHPSSHSIQTVQDFLTEKYQTVHASSSVLLSKYYKNSYLPISLLGNLENIEQIENSNKEFTFIRGRYDPLKTIIDLSQIVPKSRGILSESRLRGR